jgi:DNA-binding NarL/FixJ family response regulator
MASITCLAGIEEGATAKLRAVLRKAGAPKLMKIARFNPADLGRLAPALLLCDVDRLAVDALETMRQVRFVLPDCMIAVYTDTATSAWSRECHMAGANCLLLKLSTDAELVAGIQEALSSGCFTDLRFGDA